MFKIFTIFKSTPSFLKNEEIILGGDAMPYVSTLSRKKKRSRTIISFFKKPLSRRGGIDD